ncbi:MAG TPA: Tex-like N-terminal domain-containing protein, partial [Chloroflexota bacterium]|nr:Tex-like N-terminal domain-containing protein [Chloroflexota bacterium]
MSHADQIAPLLKVKISQVTAVIELLDHGNTIPFVARYRKEATGSLDEEQIRQISDHLTRLRNLDERRQTIREQEKLTPELEAQIHAAATLTELEDLYQPYKPKRHTRASAAREKGLEPLANLILAQIQSDQTAVQIATPFLSDAVPTPEDA